MSPTGISAAMTMSGVADGELWHLFVRQILRPSLRPGQIVLCDTRSVHTHLGVRQLIEAAGCQVCFLPPWSPDCSPIARTFSTRTTRWRQVNARPPPALEVVITDGVRTITPRDAQAGVCHGGYALSEHLL